MRKVTGTSKPHFAYDQNGQLLGEYNSSGGVLQEFVWLGGTLIAVLTNSTTAEPRVYYACSDHLNAPRVIVNAAGDVRWRWISEPFGTTVAESIPNSLENLVVNLRFPGQYFDKESGLSYNYFRDYDGTMGRYVQFDPLGLGGGSPSGYDYVGGSPVSMTDRRGLWASQKGAYVHQRAGFLVFGDQLTPEQLAIIAHGHEWADGAEHQSAQFTFMHAMRHPGQTAVEACEQSNKFLQSIGRRAFAAKRAGRTNDALFLFAVALHTMQDSTSPSHQGFQLWSGHESAMEILHHVGAEAIYPGAGSPLDQITRQAWTSFNSNNLRGFKVDCPCQ